MSTFRNALALLALVIVPGWAQAAIPIQHSLLYLIRMISFLNQCLISWMFFSVPL